MNFMISILGCILWNWIEFTVEKAEKDDDGDDKTNLSFHDYKKRHWPFWIGSLLCVPILLWIGYRQLNIDPLGSLIAPGVSLGWNDLYLLGSGIFFEGLVFAFKRIKNFYKKKTAELK